MSLVDWLRRREFPSKLVLHSYRYMLDGGTTILTGTDEKGRQHAVMLVQTLSPEGSSFGVPGRLHFDGEPVPVRSDLESKVLILLVAAEVRYTSPTDEEAGGGFKLSQNALILGDDIQQVLDRKPAENIRALRDQVVETVGSPSYVSFAAEVDQLKQRS